MADRFAKLWTDILNDPKLMSAARRGNKQLHLLPWIIVFAQRANDGGRLTIHGASATPADIAYDVPCVTARQVETALTELLAISILVRHEDGVLALSAWDKRAWSGKPSDQPEAVRKRVSEHRKRTRNADETPRLDADVTPPVTRYTPEPVTPPVTPQEVKKLRSKEVKKLRREEEEKLRREDTASSSSARTPLRDRLVSDVDRSALDALLRMVPSPSAYASEIGASLDGMAGHAHLNAIQAGQAIRDYVAAAPTTFNLRHFRSFLLRATIPSVRPTSGEESNAERAAREIDERAAKAVAHG